MKTNFLQSHIFHLYDCLLFPCLLCMTLIYVMIRNLWLIMATQRIFLNRNNSYNNRPHIKCMKIGCSFITKKEKSRTKNVKILLQNNYINNGVNNGLKQKKVSKTASYGKTKKATGCKSVRVNCWETDQVASKCQQVS